MKARIHWNRNHGVWTIHTYKACSHAQFILVAGSWETELKPDNKTNPRGFIVVDRRKVHLIDKETANLYQKIERIVYDKVNVNFSRNSGLLLLLDDTGCFEVR